MNPKRIVVEASAGLAFYLFAPFTTWSLPAMSLKHNSDRYVSVLARLDCGDSQRRWQASGCWCASSGVRTSLAF
jgi:hypothetical protein